MRHFPLASMLLGWAWFTACVPGGSASDTGASEESGSGSATEGTSSTGSDASGDPTNNPTNNPTSGAEEGNACVPGKVEACPCTGGGQGVQVCNPDGQSYGPCDCPDETSASVGESVSSNDPSEGSTTDATASTTDASSTSQGETTDGTTTNDASTTDVLPGCEDPDDAPGVEDQSLDLGDQGCQADMKSFGGVLEGDADVDWYTYHGLWGMMGCFGGPDVTTDVSASGDLRLCVFASCDQGGEMFQCEGGAQMNISPAGVPGCCDSGSLTFHLNCTQAEENAQIYIRIDQADADACVEYDVQYSYPDSF